MWASVVAIVSVAGTVYTPMPVGQARAQIGEAIDAARAESSMTVRQGSTDVLAYSSAGAMRTDSAGDVWLTFSDGNGYTQITPGARTAVRRYLQSPALTWMLMPDRLEWPAVDPLPAMFAPTTIRRAAVADGPRRYRLRTGDGERVVLTLDAAGRPHRLRAWHLQDRTWRPAGTASADYRPVSIPRPAAEQALPMAEVTPALDARTIPRRLRHVVRFTMSGDAGGRSVRDMRRAARGNVRHYNTVTPAARLHCTRLPRGVRIWGHNQYTDITYARSIVVRHGRWEVDQ